MKKLIYSVSIMLLLAIAAFGQNSASGWTDPNYRFEIKYKIDGKIYRAKVQEVAGLEEATAGNSTMPGFVKGANKVTLKKVVFTSKHSTNPFLSNLNNLKGTNTDLIIRLVDDAGKTAMVWTVKNAVPTMARGANQNKTSFETIEMLHSGIELMDITEFDEDNPFH